MAEIVFCRYLEGAVAYFSSGCKVTSLTVHPSNRITNWLSVKADANTISITWRPSRSFPTTVLKALLESVAGNLRFCYKATPAQKTRWGTTTVAGFYQPEHAQAALKWLSGMPGMQGQQLYTVYFTVSDDLAFAIIVDVENTVCRMDVDLLSGRRHDKAM